MQKHRQEESFKIFKHILSKINPKHVPAPLNMSGFHLNSSHKKNPSIYMAKNTSKRKIKKKLENVKCLKNLQIQP